MTAPDDPPPAPDPTDWRGTTRALQRIARSIVRDPGLSEDVVQSAYVSALESGHGGERIGWLRRVVRNRAIDARRHRRREPTLDGDAHERRSGAASADEVAERIETQRAVLDAVERLDGPYRDTVYLRYFEGLRVREIAARTGVPPKTVETRLTRALAALRARLGPRYRDPSSGRWTPALAAFADPRALLPPAATLTAASLPLLLLAMKKTAVLAAAVAAVALAGWIALDSGRSGQDERTASAVAAMADRGLASNDDLLPVGVDRAPERVELAGAEESGGATDAAAAAIDSEGSLRVTVRWEDGDAAEGVGVVVVTPWEAGVSRRVRDVTDATGVAFFADLAPGPYSVLTDRGTYDDDVDAEVAAGATADCSIDLEDGVDVEGRVVDATGRAVAGAAIVMTAQTGAWTCWPIVTDADGEGRFRLRDVYAGASLGAQSPGFERSLLVDLDTVDRSVQPLQLDFVLHGGGGGLEGVVTGAEGTPVAGAIVALGRFRGSTNMRFDGSYEEYWGGHTARTDAEGRYRFDSVKAATHALRVRRRGMPQWSGEVEIETGQVAHRDVALQRCATLEGVVSDEDGAPVPGARVHAFDTPLDETFLQSGQIDYVGAFAQEFAVARDDGRFELDTLPPGTMYVYAQAPRKDRRDPFEVVQFTRATIELEAGTTATWNPVLSDGRSIRGTVRYRDGSPIENIFINVTRADGGGKEHRADHVPDGEFRFIQLQGDLYDVRAQIWNLPEGAEEPRVIGVVPGGDPIELVADFDAPVEYEETKVTVRFSDDGERAGSDPVSMSIESLDEYSWSIGEREGDTWNFTLRTPGRYRAIALADERLLASGEPFDFVPGEPLDLGTLRSVPGGTLVVRLIGSDEYPPEGASMSLRHDAYRHGQRVELDRTLETRLEGIEPGAGTLHVWGKNFATTRPEYEVRAGEETAVDVELVPATRIRYRVDLPSLPGATSFTVRFIDAADGSEASKIEREDIGAYGNPLEWSTMLPPGQYRMEATLGDGRTGAASLTVPPIGTEELPSPTVDLR
ncbi:MAG: sigma-70 family RNA polymerase sigma factor [Planctomycetota bacterium]